MAILHNDDPVAGDRDECPALRRSRSARSRAGCRTRRPPRQPTELQRRRRVLRARPRDIRRTPSIHRQPRHRPLADRERARCRRGDKGDGHRQRDDEGKTPVRDRSFRGHRLAALLLQSRRDLRPHGAGGSCRVRATCGEAQPELVTALKQPPQGAWQRQLDGLSGVPGDTEGLRLELMRRFREADTLFTVSPDSLPVIAKCSAFPPPGSRSVLLPVPGSQRA